VLFMPSLMRSVINTIIPPGSAWRVSVGEDWDKLYDGIATNWETIRTFLSELDCIRNPSCTPVLDDLEQEFGVIKNVSLTEQQRRDQLMPIVFNRSFNGGLDNLEDALQAAGFTVQVHSNSPAVDPAIFLDQNFQMVAAGGNAYAGRPDAYAGKSGGELLVNGDISKTRKIVTTVAGNLYAGTGHGAGEYTDLERTEITYSIPTDPDDWPLVFFVGGDATRDGTGALTEIQLADVPIEQETEFKRIILKYKPIHSWAALIINFT
jgi:hypothetical protein